MLGDAGFDELIVKDRTIQLNRSSTMEIKCYRERDR